MAFYVNPTQEQRDEMETGFALSKMKENWGRLLEVIFEDSTLDEILVFALRLDKIPHYTRKEEFARKFIREGSTHLKHFQSEGAYRNAGFYWETHTEEPVKLIKLPQGLIEKGSKLWKIEI